MSDKSKKKDDSETEEEDAAYDAYATEKDKGKIMAIAALRFRFLPVIHNEFSEHCLVCRLGHVQMKSTACCNVIMHSLTRYSLTRTPKIKEQLMEAIRENSKCKYHLTLSHQSPSM